MNKYLMDQSMKYTRMKTMHDINMALLRENRHLREENKKLKEKVAALRIHIKKYRSKKD